MKKYWPIVAVAMFTAALIVVRAMDLHPLFRPGPVHWTATLILFLYLWGIWEKVRNAKIRKHATIMCCGMILDLGLTLYHEVGLRAVSFAMGMTTRPFEGNHGLLRFHIWVSSVLLAVYLLVWISGRALVPLSWHWLPKLRTLRAADYPTWRKAHDWIGYGTVLLNAASWLSSPYFILELLIAKVRG